MGDGRDGGGLEQDGRKPEAARDGRRPGAGWDGRRPGAVRRLRAERVRRLRAERERAWS